LPPAGNDGVACSMAPVPRVRFEERFEESATSAWSQTLDFVPTHQRA
jgi:hypothetical protein